MKKWIAILLIAVLTLSLFAACSKRNKLVGTWKTESVTVDGRKLTDEEINRMWLDVTVKLKKNGTGTLSVGWYENEPLTYDDNTATVFDRPLPYTLKGNRLIVDYPVGETVYQITLKKVK